MQSPKQLKYGRIERERRLLLEVLPSSPPDRVADIVDRYLVGTRLRLRKMRWRSGPVEYKLARKLPPHEPGAGVMGNLYLTAHEYALLEPLPAGVVRKTRRYYGRWSVDAFAAELDGLLLAEIEEDDPEVLAALEPPFAWLRDVTTEEAWTGGRLAHEGLPPSMR